MLNFKFGQPRAQAFDLLGERFQGLALLSFKVVEPLGVFFNGLNIAHAQRGNAIRRGIIDREAQPNGKYQRKEQAHNKANQVNHPLAESRC